MKVDFEVVKIYKNDIYTPYSLKPKSGDSREVYAIKVEDEFFLLGGKGEGVFICDTCCEDNYDSVEEAVGDVKRLSDNKLESEDKV